MGEKYSKRNFKHGRFFLNPNANEIPCGFKWVGENRMSC